MDDLLVILMIVLWVVIPPWLVLWGLRKIPWTRKLLQWEWEWAAPDYSNFIEAADLYPVPEEITKRRFWTWGFKERFMKDCADGRCLGCYVKPRVNGIFICNYQSDSWLFRIKATSLFLPWSALMGTADHELPWCCKWYFDTRAFTVNGSPIILFLHRSDLDRELFR